MAGKHSSWPRKATRRPPAKDECAHGRFDGTHALELAPGTFPALLEFSMKTVLLGMFALLFALALPAHAQSLPYTEGAVLEVTEVRVKDGQFDNYMQYLQERYKPMMEAQKKAGIIVDYGIYGRQPRSPDDADMYLTVVYANMGALDNMRERVDPLMVEVTGQNSAQANKAYADRGSMRTILGSELIRELRLK
jgi:hypothetical protein